MILPWSEKVFDWESRCSLARKQDEERRRKKISFALGRNYQLQSQQIRNCHKGSILKTPGILSILLNVQWLLMLTFCCVFRGKCTCCSCSNCVCMKMKEFLACAQWASLLIRGQYLSLNAYCPFEYLAPNSIVRFKLYFPWLFHYFFSEVCAWIIHYLDRNRRQC